MTPNFVSKDKTLEEDWNWRIIWTGRHESYRNYLHESFKSNYGATLFSFDSVVESVVRVYEEVTKHTGKAIPNTVITVKSQWKAGTGKRSDGLDIFKEQLTLSACFLVSLFSSINFSAKLRFTLGSFWRVKKINLEKAVLNTVFRCSICLVCTVPVPTNKKKHDGIKRLRQLYLKPDSVGTLLFNLVLDSFLAIFFKRKRFCYRFSLKRNTSMDQ